MIEKIKINIGKKTIVTLIVAFGLFVAGCIIYLSDLNRVKTHISKNIKEQLNCIIDFKDLQWEKSKTNYSINFGVSFSEFTLKDSNKELIIKAGPTKIIWRLQDVILGKFIHFETIKSKDIYLNIERDKDGKVNLLEIFKPTSDKKQPAPEIYNLTIENGHIHLSDELNRNQKIVDLKDLKVVWDKNRSTKIRTVELKTHIDSESNSQEVKLKGYFSDRGKFNWKKDFLNIYLVAKNIELDGWEAYLTNIPEIESISGIFSGIIHLKKKKNQPHIDLSVQTNLKKFFTIIKKDDVHELFKLPKTKADLKGKITEKQISIDSLESSIFELNYVVSGIVNNWSTAIPDVDINIKTNKFNFTKLKNKFPLSLLPSNAKDKIIQIKDDGFLTIDLKLLGPYITPKYFGTILLEDFNLTPESGFLNFIHGLNGKIILNDNILNVEYINIPLADSVLEIMGTVDNTKFINNINVKAKEVDISSLQGFISDADSNIAILLGDITAFGKLSLDLNILSELNKSPDITGMVNFNDTGFHLRTDPPFELNKLLGELDLDGTNIIFKKLSGLINNKIFYVDGKVSFKEDESVNLQLKAEHLDVLSSIVGYLKKFTPINPTVESIMGEFSDLDIKATGMLSEPKLDGMVVVNQIAFELPKEHISLSDLSGGIILNEKNVYLQDLMAIINQKNNLIFNASINDYLSMNINANGMLIGDVNLASIKELIDPDNMIPFTTDGTLPTILDFNYIHPIVETSFMVVVPPEFKFAVPPNISKPKDAIYNVVGKTLYNLDKQSLKIVNSELTSMNLFLHLNGSIYNLASKDPKLDLEFFSTPKTAISMVLRPLDFFKKELKFIGDIDLMGTVKGTSLNPSFFADATFTNLSFATYHKPDLVLEGESGLIKINFENNMGDALVTGKNFNYSTFNAMEIYFHANYDHPRVDIDKLHFDIFPGYLHATSMLDLDQGFIYLMSEGKDIELQKLGQFLFLNPETLKGKTNYELELTTSGMTDKALIGMASGFFRFDIQDGQIGEIKLLHKGLQAASIFKQGLFGFNIRNFANLLFEYKDGEFEKISGNLLSKNGQMNVQSFKYRAKNLLLNMFGTVNLKEMIANLTLYGYLPTKKEKIQIDGAEFEIESGAVPAEKSLISVTPTFLKKRFIIPFISTTPPQHFKVSIAGDLNDQKKINNKALSSFKWISGKKLAKEIDYFPKSNEAEPKE